MCVGSGVRRDWERVMVWPGWGHGKAGSSLLRGVKRDSRRGNERREREKEKKSKEVMGKADESTVERTHALRSVALTATAR